MFKRKKKFKPYRMKPRRVKPWWEIVWAKVILFVGAIGSLLVLPKKLFDSIDLSCSDGNCGHSHQLDDDDDDWFEHDIGTIEHHHDDISRGQWDVTSMYYPMLHSEDLSSTDYGITDFSIDGCGITDLCTDNLMSTDDFMTFDDHLMTTDDFHHGL